MAEHNGIVACALDEITAQWKHIGGAAGLVRAVVNGIYTVLAFIAFFLFGVSFADMFLWVSLATPLLDDNVGRDNALLALVRFGCVAIHPLMFLLGFGTNIFVIDVIAGFRDRLSKSSFAIPFIGVVVQIVVYACLGSVHTWLTPMWSPINGRAAGSYEKYVLTLVTCKTLYLFWIKYEFSSFLEATKKAPEDYAEVEDKDDGTAEEDEHSDNTAEMSDESEKDAEDDQSEEHAEPETSESGVTDWEME